MDEVNNDIAFRMRKRTIDSIITLFEVTWVKRAELGFVFFWTIKLLYPIVTFPAFIPIGTIIAEFTQFGNVKVPHPFTIFAIVIEGAMFMVMGVIDGAKLCLEIIQI